MSQIHLFLDMAQIRSLTQTHSQVSLFLLSIFFLSSYFPSHTDFDSKTLVAEIEPFSFHFILVDDSAGADIPIVQFDLFVSQGDAAGSTYQLSHRPLSSSSLSSSSQDGIVGARSPLVDSSDSSLSSSEANKTTKTSSVMFKIGTEFHIDFYNRQHGVWEPLIEKWDPEILVARTTVTEVLFCLFLDFFDGGF